MTNAAAKNKWVPDRVIKRKFFPRIKDSAQRINKAAGNDPGKGASGKRMAKRFNGKDNDPAHQNVGNRRKCFEAVNEKNFK